MFLRIASVLCWLACVSVVPVQKLRPVFGVQVRFQTGTTMYALVAFHDNGMQLINRKFMTVDEFVKIASGYWPSPYNPTRENLFVKYRIPCGMVNDSIHLDPIPVCFPVDSLWKIRFSDFPFNTSSESGWSGDAFRPSVRQTLFLKENYRVDDVDNNYFLDTNFWKILHDVQDSSWIVNYKSLK